MSICESDVPLHLPGPKPRVLVANAKQLAFLEMPQVLPAAQPARPEPALPALQQSQLRLSIIFVLGLGGGP